MSQKYWWYKHLSYIPVSKQISTKNGTSAKVVGCLEKYIVNPSNSEVLNKLYENYVNPSGTETLESCEW